MFNASIILILFLITVAVFVGIMFSIHYHQTFIEDNVEANTIIVNPCAVYDKINIDSNCKLFSKQHQDCLTQTKNGKY